MTRPSNDPAFEPPARRERLEFESVHQDGAVYNTVMPLDKRIVQMIEGFARADAFMEQERRERLVHLTPKQARAQWDDLTEGWEALPDKGEGLERLEMWRVETLTAVRQAFEQMARAKGLL